ncbi:MAG: flavin reductase family protein [Acidimicrobiia bacterium]|nr:flavin reductase family protein [Acidimicrobiia bacterium]MBJ7514377.1 flavin reductase family protein [Acidimicrobiia bacterium]
MTGHPDENVIGPTANKFRDALGHFATGITVITAMDDEGPVGLAANSFTSVSLDPPLVLFCPAKTSSSWPRIERAKSFAVNILDDAQEEVCRVFATPGEDRFSKVAWHLSPSGSPLLDDVHAFLDCVLHEVHDGGDHWIVVGRVIDLGIEADAGPLLYYRGQYGRLGE